MSAPTIVDKYIRALAALSPSPVCVYADELGVCDEPREGERYCAQHRGYETCAHGVSILVDCLACEPPLDPLCTFDDYDENAADDRFARYGAA